MTQVALLTDYFGLWTAEVREDISNFILSENMNPKWDVTSIENQDICSV